MTYAQCHIPPGDRSACIEELCVIKFANPSFLCYKALQKSWHFYERCKILDNLSYCNLPCAFSSCSLRSLLQQLAPRYSTFVLQVPYRLKDSKKSVTMITIVRSAILFCNTPIQIFERLLKVVSTISLHTKRPGQITKFLCTECIQPVLHRSLPMPPWETLPVAVVAFAYSFCFLGFLYPTLC